MLRERIKDNSKGKISCSPRIIQPLQGIRCFTGPINSACFLFCFLVTKSQEVLGSPMLISFWYRAPLVCQPCLHMTDREIGRKNGRNRHRKKGTLLWRHQDDSAIRRRCLPGIGNAPLKLSRGQKETWKS